jgi:hypothetical protein
MGGSTGIRETDGKRGNIAVLDVISNSRSAREPGVDLWRRTLSQIPTVFGRLVYLASLRDAVTKRYVHPSLTHLLGTEDADRTICHSHHQVFSQWIGFSLAEQKADLDEYMGGAGWKLLVQQYRNLVPLTARDVERQLYLTDLETLVELMRYASEDACEVPIA